MSGSSRCISGGARFPGSFFWFNLGTGRPSRVPQEESEKPQSSQGQSRPTSRFLALSCFRNFNDGHFACIFCLRHVSCVTSAWPTCSFCAFFCFVIFFRSSLQLGWAVPWSFGVGLAARAASSGRSPKHLGEIFRRKNRWKNKRVFNEVSLSAWKRERRRMRSQRVMKWPGTIGTWVHTDSYGFIWVLCRAGHQIYACLWGCYVMSSKG